MDLPVYQLGIKASENAAVVEDCGLVAIPSAWINFLPQSALLGKPVSTAPSRVLSGSIFAKLFDADPTWSAWTRQQGGLEHRVVMLMRKVTFVKRLWASDLMGTRDPSPLMAAASGLLNATEQAYEECVRANMAQTIALRQLVDRTAAKLYALCCLAKLQDTEGRLPSVTFAISDWPEAMQAFVQDSEQRIASGIISPDLTDWKRRLRRTFDKMSVLHAKGVDIRGHRQAVTANFHGMSGMGLQKLFGQASRADGHLASFSRPPWLVFDTPSVPEGYPLRAGLARCGGDQPRQQDDIRLETINVALTGDTVQCPMFFVADLDGPNGRLLEHFETHIRTAIERYMSERADDSHDSVYKAIASAFLEIDETWEPDSPEQDAGLSVTMGLTFNGHLYAFGLGTTWGMIIFPDRRMARLFPTHRVRQEHRNHPECIDAHMLKRIFSRGGITFGFPQDALVRVMGTHTAVSATGAIGHAFVGGLSAVPFVQVVPLEDAKGAQILVGTAGLEPASKEALGFYAYLKKDGDLSAAAENMIIWGYKDRQWETGMRRIEASYPNSSALIVQLPS